MYLSRLRNTDPTNFLPRVMLLALLAIFGAGCSSDRDQPYQVAQQPRPADPIPPAQPPEQAAEVASQSSDTNYSDAPGCNELVKRLADEMVPCLERVKPEMAGQLQTMINTFSKNPRMLLDPTHREEVLKRTEEDCRSHWRSITYQIDSKSPERQCRFEIPN